jgi:type IV secretory pathway VirD2 relaxase
MKDIHQVIRFNYTRISDNIQSELKFLSELAELTDDERFKQSVAEVIYSLNDLSETLNLQRRYLKSRFDAE